jgi:hypothetical protein
MWKRMIILEPKIKEQEYFPTDVELNPAPVEPSGDNGNGFDNLLNDGGDGKPTQAEKDAKEKEDLKKWLDDKGIKYDSRLGLKKLRILKAKNS